MIIKFSPDLFICNDNNIYSVLSKILLEVLEDRFLWDIENIENIFLSDDFDFFDLDFTKRFLSPEGIDNLKERVYTIIELSAYITSEHKKYLTTLAIGLKDNEINPVNFYKILNEKSLIILENGINDFKFIKGIIQKYATKKNIYKLIKKAIDKHWLVSENAGGAGGYENIIRSYISGRYNNIHKFKIFALFDSDRSSKTDFNDKYSNLINYLKNTQNESIKFDDCICNIENDIIYWHILYKREIENYIPITLLKEYVKDITEKEYRNLGSKSNDELDFIDFELFFKNNKNIDVKSLFPDLFLKNWTRDLLEKICEHHKVKAELPNETLQDVSEIEQILLKIAKII